MNATTSPLPRLLTLLCMLAAAPILAQTAPQDGSQPARRYVNLPKAVQAPFSDGVLVGNTLYIAGRLGLDAKTGKLPDDVEQEAHIVLDGVKSVLIEAGMTMDDLVFVQVFSPDVSLYPKFNEVYKAYFGKDYPARAFVGSGPLLRGAHFEINGIAVKR
jgi:2-iminobutanoate/2-iminopropanoate deaminase